MMSQLAVALSRHMADREEGCAPRFKLPFLERCARVVPRPLTLLAAR